MQASDWIEYPNRKPKHDCTCYVANSKAGLDCFVALYVARWDIFREYNPQRYHSPALEVTHYVILPYAPQLEN